MPYFKKKICSEVGCNGYALPNSAYCELHQKEQNRNTTSKYAEFYHKTVWKKARKTFLERTENIYCAKCLEKGIYTPADTVHHVKGFCDFNTFMTTRNWVAWCSSCHSSYHTKITNEELYNKNKENF